MGLTRVRLTPEEFQRAINGSRLSETAVEAAQQLLVVGRPTTEVAKAFALSKQRMSNLRNDILKRHKTASIVKVTAEQYLIHDQQHNEVLVAFSGELRKLAAHGRSIADMLEYLKANEVEATAEEIQTVLGNRKGDDENSGVRESERRSG